MTAITAAPKKQHGCLHSGFYGPLHKRITRPEEPVAIPKTGTNCPESHGKWDIFIPFSVYVREEHGWWFESVKRTELHKFKVIPKRWVVERTIGWMNNFRGLSKHYDYDATKTGESKIYLASMFYMTKRLTTPPEPPKWSLENDAKIKMKLENINNST